MNMPEDKENHEVTVGVDIDQDGKSDFKIKLKGNKKIILVCIGCFIAGALSTWGYTTLM